jgi:hypothetical protein
MPTKKSKCDSLATDKKTTTKAVEWVGPRGARDPIPDPGGLAPGLLSTAFANLRTIKLEQFAPIDHEHNYRAQAPSLCKWRQVEHLLSQVSTLLDRCLAARSEFRDVLAKSFTTWIELAEFDALDAIHKDETQAGCYELDAGRSLMAVQAASEERTGLEAAQRFLVETIGGIANPGNIHDK